MLFRSKARGVGGRSSNKKLNKNESFDHGVQYISPKSIKFKKFIKNLMAKKIVKKWEGKHLFLNKDKKEDKKHIKIIGKKGNNAISKYLLKDINCNFNSEVIKIFNKNKFSGFIDFYFSSNDYLMYEIAICINALCFDKKRNSFVMNNKKIKYLIDGYETIRTISKKEKDALNILCRGAALRYLLTRIYDYFNTPKTALIQVKEPNEYFQKLIIHNNLNSYKDYYK